MSYSLGLAERKKQLNAEIANFTHTVSSFDAVNVDQEIASKSQAQKMALFADQLSPWQVVELANKQKINYIIQNSLQPLLEKLKIVTALDKNDLDFYLEDFTFFPHSITKHTIVFDSNTPRKSILNMAFQHLEIDVEANRSHHLKSAIEEMIMNAQIDARHLGNKQVNLKSTLILEKMDKLVAVSTIDFYGTLTYSKFTSQVASVLSVGVSDSINHNRQRGAGIGSSIIFNAADSLYLGCIPGVKTRVTAIIPFGLSDTNQEKLQKSLFLL